ncbi:MAG: lysophospholipid acyltransferase family protein [Bacteroidetes bacterium]|nr:lysophospholipid acyltransferase family protein [Bacteroidota bacterium]
MQAIGFYLALPFLYLISILPFPLLYLFSDFVFVLIYYVIGYRKKVVTQNLRNSFPEKSEKEICTLRRKFYRYLCDLFLETFKTLTISKEAMLKHCRMNEESAKLMQKYFDEKKNIIIVLGHLGNWEWGGNTFSLQCRQQLYVIYHPLENKYFNKLVIGMRTRFGTKLIEMKNTFRDMVSNKKIISATAFIADQTPPPESAYWTIFLNQDTPVFQGTEKISRKMNYPIVFINVKKIRRGYYEMTGEMLCENPASTSEGEISQLHTKKLESEIRKNPETWLWSHRRWKHKRPAKN